MEDKIAFISLGRFLSARRGTRGLTSEYGFKDIRLVASDGVDLFAVTSSGTLVARDRSSGGFRQLARLPSAADLAIDETSVYVTDTLGGRILKVARPSAEQLRMFGPVDSP